jgi:hypothetical protein
MPVKRKEEKETYFFILEENNSIKILEILT